MSPAVRVGNPRGPGPGVVVEEAAAAVAWRELRGKAAELAAAAEEGAILARRIEGAFWNSTIMGNVLHQNAIPQRGFAGSPL